jgi:hypothetical protein
VTLSGSVLLMVREYLCIILKRWVAVCCLSVEDALL